MKFYIKTFGCRVNQVESEALLEELISKGHILTDDIAQADLCLINTCSVTRNADKDALKEAKSIVKKNPSCKLILTGCYARHGIKEICEKVPKAEVINKEVLPQKLFGHNIDWVVSKHQGKTRAFVKIQDGCDNFCTYCIVPFTRPIKSSKPKEIVLKEIKNLLKQGYKEIVLTGINIGNYLCPITKTNLANLLKEIFTLEGNFRIRFSSIELPTITKELLEVAKSGGAKFCNYLHLPLQSGTDKVLKDMHRHYTTKDFFANVKKIKEMFNGVFIYTDIIAGFPTESKEDFLETINFLKKVSFAGLHVFSYSARPMTYASTLPQNTPQEIKYRADTLRKLDLEFRTEKAISLLGSVQEVLLEEKHDSFMIGTASNFQRVFVNTDKGANSLIKVKITEVKNGLCFGKEI